MKRVRGCVFTGIALFAMIGPVTGCAPARKGVEATPEISVRVPAVESPDVSLQAEDVRNIPGEPSVLTDDTQRPWLKIIEVDIYQKETEKTDVPAESPGQ